MNKQILAVDIDGTLVNPQKELTEKTERALKKYMAEGKTLVLCTGRPPHGITRYAKQLDIASHNGYIVAYNGAQITEAATGKVLRESALNPELLPKIIRAARKYDLQLVGYRGDDAVLECDRPNQYFDIEVKINGLGTRVVPDLIKEFTYPVPRFLIPGEPERLAEIETLFREELGGVKVFRSEPFFLEILPDNVDKSTALMQLVEYLGTTRENLTAFGDGFNDITMLRYAGRGIAMGNAQEAAKQAADFITLSNTEDGIAYAIEKFKL